MRKFIALLTTIVLIFVMTACSSTKETINTETTPATASTIDCYGVPEGEEVCPVTLITVSMFGGTDPNAAKYQARNKKFMDEYSDMSIEDD